MPLGLQAVLPLFWLSDELWRASSQYTFIHSRPAIPRYSERPKRRVNCRTQNEAA